MLEMKKIERPVTFLDNVKVCLFAFLAVPLVYYVGHLLCD